VVEVIGGLASTSNIGESPSMRALTKEGTHIARKAAERSECITKMLNGENRRRRP